MQRLKQLWSQYQSERKRQRELNLLLNNLTDPTFLDRACQGQKTAE